MTMSEEIPTVVAFGDQNIHARHMRRARMLPYVDCDGAACGTSTRTTFVTRLDSGRQRPLAKRARLPIPPRPQNR